MSRPPSAPRCTRLALVLLCAAFASPAHAVLFDATGDPAFNTEEPTGALAGSGWQFLGLWGDFLGAPIAPRFFLTAQHINGRVGEPFLFDGVRYTTDAFYDVPDSDLRLWRVTADFPRWAPLHTGQDEVGKPLVVFGRGTQRGAEVRVNGELRGWENGLADLVLRWGTNQVSAIEDRGPNDGGEQLVADFGHIGGAEAHLSLGDSGGPVFLYSTATARWELAGVNFDVSGDYYTDATGAGPLHASLFDQLSLFLRNPGGDYEPAPAGPGKFYATRVSTHLPFIQATIPEPGAAALLALAAALALARRRPL